MLNELRYINCFRLVLRDKENIYINHFLMKNDLFTIISHNHKNNFYVILTKFGIHTANVNDVKYSSCLCLN